jgi:hypothetical protein
MPDARFRIKRLKEKQNEDQSNNINRRIFGNSVRCGFRGAGDDDETTGTGNEASDEAGSNH